MKSISDIKFILHAYAKLPFRARLFILVRYFVCPWQIILDHIKPGKVLDIGCGHGLFLHLAAKRYPDIQCSGFDHDKKKINAAFLSLPRNNLSFSLDSGIGRLKEGSFDYVTIIDVLYSVPEEKWPELFSLASKYLKPDGVLIIKETVNRPKWKFYICLLQETFAIKVMNYTKGESPRILPAAYYLRQISANNFVIRKHCRIDYKYPWPHYLFVGTKKK